MMPGIVKLGWIRADSLPDFLDPVIYIDEEKLLDSVRWFDIAGVATLQEEKNNSFLEITAKTKLDFVSSESIGKRVGFMAVDAEGNIYVVGNAPPHCGSLAVTAQYNEPSGKASAFYYSFSVPVPIFKL